MNSEQFVCETQLSPVSDGLTAVSLPTDEIRRQIKGIGNANKATYLLFFFFFLLSFSEHAIHIWRSTQCLAIFIIEDHYGCHR